MRSNDTLSICKRRPTLTHTRTPRACGCEHMHYSLNRLAYLRDWLVPGPSFIDLLFGALGDLLFGLDVVG